MARRAKKDENGSEDEAEPPKEKPAQGARAGKERKDQSATEQAIAEIESLQHDSEASALSSNKAQVEAAAAPPPPPPPPPKPSPENKHT